MGRRSGRSIWGVRSTRKELGWGVGEEVEEGEGVLVDEAVEGEA